MALSNKEKDKINKLIYDFTKEINIFTNNIFKELKNNSSKNSNIELLLIDILQKNKDTEKKLENEILTIISKNSKKHHSLNNFIELAYMPKKLIFNLLLSNIENNNLHQLELNKLLLSINN